MLPNSIFSSYKQYKADTDVVASWLTITAESYGYVRSASLKQSQASRQEPKLKGRARKLAREAPTKEQQGTSEPAPSGGSSTKPDLSTLDGPVYIIPINEFVILAEHIAKKCKSAFRTPYVFAIALDRAIKIRSHHNVWHRQNNENPAQDEGHSHFVSVLQKVRDVLKPYMPRAEQSKKAKQPEQGRPLVDDETIANMFEGLAVEEPSSFILPPPTASSSATPRPIYRAEEVQDSEEARLAFRCLFEDLLKLLDFIRQMWAGFDYGKYHLTVASIATNTAINLVKGLEEDFLKHFPDHPDCGQLLRTNYEEECAAHGVSVSVSENPFLKALNADSVDDKTIQTTFADILVGTENYDIAEKSLILTYTLMNVYRNPKNLPTGFNKRSKPNDFEDRADHPKFKCPFPLTPAEIAQMNRIRADPDRYREDLTAKEKWLQDLGNMAAVMPELYIYTCHFRDTIHLQQSSDPLENMKRRLKQVIKGRGHDQLPVDDHLPVEDEFTKAVRLLICGDRLSLWAIFAAQVFLITHHELTGQRRDRAFHECFRICGWQSSAVLECMSTVKHSHILQGWMQPNTGGSLETLQVYWTWVWGEMGDYLYGKYRKDYLTETYWKLDRAKRFFQLFIEHPLLSGLMTFDIKVHMRWMTDSFLDHPILTSAAHLYYTLRLASPTPIARWADMELVWYLYGLRSTFRGGPPARIDEVFDKWLLSNGFRVGPTGSKLKTIHASKLKRETFEDFFPVCQMLKASDLSNAKRASYTIEDIEKILRKKRTDHFPPSQSNGEFAKITITKPEGFGQYAGEENSPGGRFTLLQALHSLCDAIQWEDEALNFDLLGMHMRCLRFLESLYKQLKVILGLPEPDTTPGGYTHLYTTAHLFFNAIKHRQKFSKPPPAAQGLSKKDFSDVPLDPANPFSEIKRRLARVYEDMVRRGHHTKITLMYPRLYEVTVGFHNEHEDGRPSDHIRWLSPQDYEFYDVEMVRTDGKGSDTEGPDYGQSDDEDSADKKSDGEHLEPKQAEEE